MESSLAGHYANAAREKFQFLQKQDNRKSARKELTEKDSGNYGRSH
jgi:hypothetical protein